MVIQKILTVSGHPHSDALLEPAVLTPVAIDAQDGALLILGAGTILYLLLDAASKEALRTRRTLWLLTLIGTLTPATTAIILVFIITASDMFRFTIIVSIGATL